MNKIKRYNSGVYKDLTGKRYGKLVAVSRIITGVGVKSRWLCLCDCGKSKVVVINDLTNGQCKSCGCGKIKKKYKDIKGQVFGKLTALSIVGEHKGYYTRWLCQCECGKTKEVEYGLLSTDETKTCGCGRIERKKKGRALASRKGKKRHPSFFTQLINQINAEDKET